jgi:nucleoid DNA-binding protein
MMLLLETASYGRPGSLTIFITPSSQMLYDEDVAPAIAVTYSSLGVKALIKQDIIHQVIAKTGLPRNKAEAAVDTVFESLKKALASGDRIELRGFGVFNVRPRKTGIGRNPRTGAEVTITPGKAVRFKPGKELHLLDS